MKALRIIFIIAFMTLELMPVLAADLAADFNHDPSNKYSIYYNAANQVQNWSGLYIGVHIGGRFPGDNKIYESTLDKLSIGYENKFIGGIQAGYDFQLTPNWVLGVEHQYTKLDVRDPPSVSFPAEIGDYVEGRLAYRNDPRGLLSITGRLGHIWDQDLLYIKGGWAFSEYKRTLIYYPREHYQRWFLEKTWLLTPADFGHFYTQPSEFLLHGYTVGAGLEHLITQKWTGKIEYMYFDFGMVRLMPMEAWAPTDEHIVRAGLNYHLNWGDPADRPSRLLTENSADYAMNPVHNWSGFYIGGHIGGTFGGNNKVYTNNNYYIGSQIGFTKAGYNYPPPPPGFLSYDDKFIGGVQLGYDFHFLAPNLVVGIESEYTIEEGGQPSVLRFKSFKRSVSGRAIYRNKLRHLVSLTGRVGYPLGETLLYMKGGLVIAEYDRYMQFTSDVLAERMVLPIWSEYFTLSNDLPLNRGMQGYTIGAGLERLITQSWACKIEYIYANLGNIELPPWTWSTNEEHIVKASLNYHLNWY